VRVLVVEDELKLAKVVREMLRVEGALADVAVRGEDALWMVPAHEYDVVCLDVNLPGIDGFETCRRLRAAGERVPILMLTARDAVGDRITGLDTGADDYLVKPFDLGELAARLRALARRGPTEQLPVLTVGDLSFDLATRRVARAGTELRLSVKEQQILEVLMRHPGRPVSRVDLLEGAWDDSYENRSNIIDVYIRSLREKIDRPFGVESLRTVRGIGYAIEAVEPAR
jgi:two-component system, OmpR family, response regulator